MKLFSCDKKIKIGMDSPSQVNKLRKSRKFHQGLTKANHEKGEEVDNVLRYGERIGDKDSNNKVPTHE